MRGDSVHVAASRGARLRRIRSRCESFVHSFLYKRPQHIKIIASAGKDIGSTSEKIVWKVAGQDTGYMKQRTGKAVGMVHRTRNHGSQRIDTLKDFLL